jgi:predicted ester cyclase
MLQILVDNQLASKVSTSFVPQNGKFTIIPTMNQQVEFSVIVFCDIVRPNVMNIPENWYAQITRNNSR